MKTILNILAGVTGLIAAGLWWTASTTKQKPMESFVHATVEHNMKYPYLDRIAWWNKWAAFATGFSVLASSVANFL